MKLHHIQILKAHQRELKRLQTDPILNQTITSMKESRISVALAEAVF